MKPKMSEWINEWMNEWIIYSKINKTKNNSKIYLNHHLNLWWMLYFLFIYKWNDLHHSKENESKIQLSKIKKEE